MLVIFIILVVALVAAIVWGCYDEWDNDGTVVLTVMLSIVLFVFICVWTGQYSDNNRQVKKIHETQMQVDVYSQYPELNPQVDWKQKADILELNQWLMNAKRVNKRLINYMPDEVDTLEYIKYPGE